MNFTLLAEQFSEPRLQPYLDAAGGDEELAVDLYDWNIRMGAACFEDLSILEILVKNAFDRVLRTGLGRDWYESQLLQAQDRMVSEAKTRITGRTGCEPEPDQVVAELPFGFWRSLVGPGYQQTLWKTLLGAFSSVPSTAKIHRGDVDDRLTDLWELRNSVAHHWPIFNWDFDKSVWNMKMVAGGIAPRIQIWMTTRSRIPQLQQQNPVRLLRH